MQIYTCNVSSGQTLYNGKILKQYDAICFEPQYVGAFDSNYDNHLAKLRKGQHYQHFIKLEIWFSKLNFLLFLDNRLSLFKQLI